MESVKNRNFFSLDLELNNLNNGEVPKIIEVGVAIGSPLKDEIVSHNWYLDPGEPISPFISNLTGITDEVVKEKSVSHETVAKELGCLINVYECFTNPVTWGQGDADELKAEFSERAINFPFFGRRIFDVKTIYVFDQIVKGNALAGGLRKALSTYGLKFKGTPHRAKDDAENTLLLFFHLINKSKKTRYLLSELKSHNF